VGTLRTLVYSAQIQNERALYQKRGTARTLPKFVLFSVLFVLCRSVYIVCVCVCVCVCKCVLYYCHRVATQLQLTNVSSYGMEKKLLFNHLELRQVLRQGVTVDDEVSVRELVQVQDISTIRCEL